MPLARKGHGPLRAVALWLTVGFAAAAGAQTQGALECPAPWVNAGSGQPGMPDLTASFVDRPSSSPFTPTERKADLYISASDAAARAVDIRTVLVDTRPPRQYARIRAAGSLNVPAHQIQAKRFLRGKTLLLLEDGHSYRKLESVAARWADKGGKAFIVEGGLSAWAATVGQLEGPGHPGDARAISPNAYLSERDYGHWRTVAVVRNEGESTTKSIDMQATLTFDTAPERLRSEIETLSRPAVEGELLPLVLVVAEAGEGYPRIQAALGDSAPWNVFYLSGGAQAYEQHLARVSAVHRRDPSRPGGDLANCAVN